MQSSQYTVGDCYRRFRRLLQALRCTSHASSLTSCRLLKQEMMSACPIIWRIGKKLQAFLTQANMQTNWTFFLHQQRGELNMYLGTKSNAISDEFCKTWNQLCKHWLINVLNTLQTQLNNCILWYLKESNYLAAKMQLNAIRLNWFKQLDKLLHRYTTKCIYRMAQDKYLRRESCEQSRHSKHLKCSVYHGNGWKHWR